MHRLALAGGSWQSQSAETTTNEGICFLSFGMSVYCIVSLIEVTNGSRPPSTSPKNGLPNELVQIFNEIKSKGRNRRDREGPRTVRY